MTAMLSGKKKYIIDRTVLEMVRMVKNMKIDMLRDFCLMLAKIGVDFFEVDRDVIDRISGLEEEETCIFRVETQADIDVCVRHKFQHCIINCKTFILNYDLIYRKLGKRNIFLEMDVNHPSGIDCLKRMKGIVDFKSIFGLQLKGLHRCILYSWEQLCREVKESTGVRLAICPENRYGLATAVALEGLGSGVDYITATFTGEGGQFGYAAFGEVLMGLKVILGCHVEGNTEMLLEASAIYEQLMGKEVNGSKPVIGRDIFKYESGIHANGIQKDPSTYEPYPPETVGQQRRLVVGKHSGTGALVEKLTEFGMGSEGKDLQVLLNKIREKSIQLKRSIIDDELAAICSE